MRKNSWKMNNLCRLSPPQFVCSQNSIKPGSKVFFYTFKLTIFFRASLECISSPKKTTKPIRTLKILIKMALKLIRWFLKTETVL